MHWILQENLFRETEWEHLVAAIDRFDLPFSVHKVVPFVGELEPVPVLQADKAVCFGSYSMRHAAKAHGWNPGVYDLFDQDFLVQKAAWGDRMLNADSRVMAFQEVRLDKPTFLRPIDDSKYFAGRVFDPEEFETWRQRVWDLDEDYGTSLSPTTQVQLCVPKTIHAEYRFWVAGGEIVTKSLYKLGRRVVYATDVDERMDRFVERAIADWQPHRAFVIDVCDTPEGPRIVEINTINSAGFYAGDVQRLVAALEALEN
ncbi:MAG: ATP-grasp domain-containing protein [Lysobacter sp.]|nr:ATP-grasp domain-containing protein [Lysobacter sp.]